MFLIEKLSNGTKVCKTLRTHLHYEEYIVKPRPDRRELHSKWYFCGSLAEAMELAIAID